MKKLKFLPFMVMMMLASFTFVSCSDDDDDVSKMSDDEIEESIIGTWKCVKYEGWYMDDDVKVPDNEEDEDGIEFLVLNSNNTGYLYEELETNARSLTWEIKNKKLYTKVKETSYYTEDYDATILELTSSVLVLESYYKDEDDDFEEYSKQTYVRIK